MGRTVIATYESAYVAKKVYSDLIETDYPQENIVLTTEYLQGKTLTIPKAKSVHSEIFIDELKAGSAIGAGIGGSLGIVGGFFAAIGEINIPFLNPTASGNINLLLEIAALIGIGLVVGTILGRILGGAIGQGIPESEIEQYAKTVHQSNFTLYIMAAWDAMDEMMEILERYNPLEIHQKPIEWKTIRRKEKKLVEQEPNVDIRKHNNFQ